MDKKNKNNFIECDECWIRPQPILCNGCLHNKRVIERLKRTIESQQGHIKKLKTKLNLIK